MTFIESIKTCFKKYITIKGRAPRSEYWWFQAMFVPLTMFVVIMSEAENLENSSELILLFYFFCFNCFSTSSKRFCALFLKISVSFA